MNSGVLYALESADEEEFNQAVAGYRYYGFDDIAALLERAFPQSQQLGAMALSAAEALEAELDDAYTQRIPLDQVIVEAFEEHLAARPNEYAPVPR